MQAETTPTFTVSSRLTRIDDEVRKKVLEVLEQQPYYAGPETAAFEAEVAAYCGVAHGVSANSGTSALLLSLMALGITRGDEVIVPTNTFASVPECVLFLGGTVVFCDVEEDGNISRTIIERHLSERTKAVIPVHMFGHPVDLDPIVELGAQRGFAIVEDAAHALGATYKGRRVGSIGDVGMFSFAGKSITVCGQAGMAVTHRADLADKMSMLRVHGWRQKRGGEGSIAHYPGLNLRTSEVLAAIGRVHLGRLEEWTAVRRRNADFFTERFRAAELPIQYPETRPDQEPGWLHYVVRVPQRDALRTYLAERGVRTTVHYDPPLHRQPAFADLVSDPDAFPVSDARAADSLTIPTNPWLSEDELTHVSDSVIGFYGSA
jgi:dTDP-4-amino-4,6-dideoxygalactose transaminase